jgi:hypothetical protein
MIQERSVGYCFIFDGQQQVVVRQLAGQICVG